MPYLPTTTNAPTTFPTPFGKDYQTQLRMVNEKWNRQFPLITYYRIKSRATPQTNPNTPVGESGDTKWDAVYGESVDPSMTSIVQPHLTDGYRPFNTDLFEAPVSIRLRTDIEASDDELKQWGFEKKEDMIAAATASQLDALGVTCQPGDYFLWNDRSYVVRRVGTDGRWKNTTAKLYVMLNCVVRRIGS